VAQLEQHRSGRDIERFRNQDNVERKLTLQDSKARGPAALALMCGNVQTEARLARHAPATGRDALPKSDTTGA